jgi:DNA repair exonuclease SbcCD nuclease subunit
MKISVISDLHLGFASNSELEMDSFDNAEEAINKSLDSDLIIICGDIFDVRYPKTQTWANALKVLTKPLLADNKGLKLVSCSKELKEIITKRTLSHLPIIALHGNHERRAREELNAVQALENAGILIHLNLDTVIFEKDGIKVAIHGMSNVPERYAKDILDRWNPKPIPNCFNILLLHQSIEPYVFSQLEPPTLSLSNLPKGFDLIINGHIHEHTEVNLGSTKFLIPGSTVVTQFEKNEAETEKGFYEIYLDDNVEIKFVPLEKSRKFFYEDVSIDSYKTIREIIEDRVSKLLLSNYNKKPVIKFRIFGKETKLIDKELSEIKRKYENSAILMFSKKLTSEETDSTLEILRNIIEQKMSIEEIGMAILNKNLEKLGFEKSFDSESFFYLLSEGNVDTVINLLLGEQSTLKGKFL